MQKLTAEDPETRSLDLIAENIAQLKALFPEAFTEGKVDFDVLRQLLGGAVEEREEKYGLNWHGKRRARQLALTPSTGTLRPCPEESVEWDTTRNLMIEGDNLEVLKLLQKSYAGKVKLIYIDPPYNTGKDFVYPDDYRDNIRNYRELTGQVDGVGRPLTSNKEASGRFHTNWLSMMYPRLKLARNLLRDDGIIFISIDSTEVANLRLICDDVFSYELLLKLGLDLCVPIESRTIAGKSVHSIGAGTLMVCLAEEISGAEVEPLALGIVDWHQELVPAGETNVVFRDSAFGDDVAKTNLTAILQQHGLDNVRSL